jgi:hypothetical protein
LWDELEATQRSALFHVFQGVTLYLVPVSKGTKEFLRRMGLDLESYRAYPHFDAGREVGGKCLEDVESLEGETHLYAFMS